MCEKREGREQGSESALAAVATPRQPYGKAPRSAATQKKQKNRLLKLEIIITVATFSLALYNLAAGVLGENLVLPGAWTADVQGFVAINGTMLTLCVAAFFGIVHFMRKRKLI